VAVAAECHSRFGFGFQRKLTVAFDGGEITTDAGLLLVREFDDRLGLTAALRAAVPDPRDRRYVSHDVLTLLRQRIYQIAAGYEDANDAIYLRHDPTLQSVAHRLGVPLGSQPTLSRLENAVPWDTIRRLSRVLRQWFPANDAAATSLSVAPGAMVIFGTGGAVGISVDSNIGFGSSRGSARILAKRSRRWSKAAAKAAALGAPA
jgi:hypothetical protein